MTEISQGKKWSQCLSENKQPWDEVLGRFQRKFYSYSRGTQSKSKYTEYQELLSRFFES